MQKYIWVAEYTDGTYLKEFDDDGSENSFYSIDKNKLKRFGLVGEGKNYWFDCRTGVFYIDGKEVCVRLVDENRNIYEFMRQNGYYNDIIQYKQASIEINPLTGEAKGKIELHAVGWKGKIVFKGVSFYVKFIVNIDLARNMEYLYVWIVSDSDIKGKVECQLHKIMNSFDVALKPGIGGELKWEL